MFDAPAPPKLYLAVPRAPPAVHEEPLYDSVHATEGEQNPPKANAAVFVPAPANLFLAVPRAPPAVQAEPLYDSVHAHVNCPPKANAAVFDAPAPANLYLVVPRAPPVVQAAEPATITDAFNEPLVELNQV